MDVQLKMDTRTSFSSTFSLELLSSSESSDSDSESEPDSELDAELVLSIPVTPKWVGSSGILAYLEICALKKPPKDV
jgi:hypothetical protein